MGITPAVLRGSTSGGKVGRIVRTDERHTLSAKDPEEQIGERVGGSYRARPVRILRPGTGRTVPMVLGHEIRLSGHRRRDDRQSPRELLGGRPVQSGSRGAELPD